MYHKNIIGRQAIWIVHIPSVPAVHGAIGCSQKSFKLVWRCHQVLPGFLTEGHLPRVPRQSRVS